MRNDEPAEGWPGFESDYPRALRAAERCRADFMAVCAGLLGTIDLPVTPVRRGDTGYGFLVGLVLDGQRVCATSISAEADEETAAYLLVDGLCQDLGEELALRSIAKALHWPLCLGHDHSLSLKLDDQGAYWECPMDATKRTIVGSVTSLIS
jgi:hypothetical protein